MTDSIAAWSNEHKKKSRGKEICQSRALFVSHVHYLSSPLRPALICFDPFPSTVHLTKPAAMSNAAASTFNGGAHVEKRARNAQAVVRYRDRRRQHIEELKEENAGLQTQLDQANRLIQQLQQAAATTTDEKLIQTTQKLIQLGLDCHLLRTENEHLRQLARQSAFHAILTSNAPLASSAATNPEAPPYAFASNSATVPFADATKFTALTSTAPANTRLRKRRRSSHEPEQDLHSSNRCTQTPETHPPSTPAELTFPSHATFFSESSPATFNQEDSEACNFLPLAAFSSLASVPSPSCGRTRHPSLTLSFLHPLFPCVHSRK